MGKIVGLTFGESIKADGKYICPVCGKEYKTAKTLEEHVVSKHPEHAKD